MPAAPVVLDSHALVAYFRDEAGAEQVEALLAKAAASERPLHMTEVNYAEAKYTLIRKDGPEAWEASARILTGLPIEFHPVTRALADQAADYKIANTVALLPGRRRPSHDTGGRPLLSNPSRSTRRGP